MPKTRKKKTNSRYKAINNDTSAKSSLECAVCLQNCVHPIKLACEHIFCFLCAKGVASQNKTCPMCRQDISLSLIDQPNLIQLDQETSCNEEPSNSTHDKYSWFYEGRKGWWEYEERTVTELEEAYQLAKKDTNNLDNGGKSDDKEEENKSQPWYFHVVASVILVVHGLTFLVPHDPETEDTDMMRIIGRWFGFDWEWMKHFTPYAQVNACFVCFSSN